MKPIEMNLCDLEELKRKEEKSLVGKVYSDRTIGKDIVRSMMERIWWVSKKTEFQEIEASCFVVTFAN